MSALVQPYTALGDKRPSEYEQLINYLFLYNEGDECEDVTGGWAGTVNGRQAGTLTKNAESILVTGTSGDMAASTQKTIPLSEYKTLNIKIPSGAVSTTYPDNLVWILFLNSSTASNECGTTVQVRKPTSYPCFNTYDLSEYCTSDAHIALNVYKGNVEVDAFWLTKPDDYQTLCTKSGISAPTDLTTLIADTTSLATIFSNEDAVRLMVAQCTGDFMVGVLNNADAVALLKASPYLNLVIANPHWAKFAMMIPNAKELLGFTMLYDEGDECTDVTGGWVNSAHASGGGTFELTDKGLLLKATTTNASTASRVRPTTNNPIDTTSYSKAHVVYNPIVASGTSSNRNIGLWLLSDKASTNSVLSNDIYFNSSANIPTCAVISSDLTGSALGHVHPAMSLYNGPRTTGASTVTGSAFFLTKPDNWKKWAFFAGVTDFSDMTTLVADSTAMAKLMSNEQAVKYLMGCTGDLMVAICNSEVAMSALVNNIAYDYAFAHPVWYKFMTMIPTALAAMDSVAVTVPTMTSNTAPSGVASTDSINGAGADACYAFDKNDNSGWFTKWGVAPPHWVQYTFTEFIDLYAVDLYFAADSGETVATTGYISVSGDGENFEKIYDFTSFAPATLHKLIFDKAYRCRTVRITLTAYNNNNYMQKSCRVYEAQFYGKAVN